MLFHRNGVSDGDVYVTGTLQTPHILELSGIGNAEILKKHDIDVLVNLPGVGENMRM